MRTVTRTHAIAVAASAGSVAALTGVVALNGYRDFGSPFWFLNAAQVGVLGYGLTLLVSRAVARENGFWKRASAFGAAAGSVLAVLAFARLADLSTSGILVALALTGALGGLLGLAAVEGLRWVQGDSATGTTS